MELTMDRAALLARLRELPDGLHIPPDICPQSEAECSWLLSQAVQLLNGPTTRVDTSTGASCRSDSNVQGASPCRGRGLSLQLRASLSTR